MTKTIIKALSIIFLFIVLIIFYLSIFGIKTDKFNNKITNKILQINKKINVDLGSISFLLNPYNLTINVIAKNPRIKLKDNELKFCNLNFKKIAHKNKPLPRKTSQVLLIFKYRKC
jgi:hypothetical protein